jgi:hypothetical protein
MEKGCIYSFYSLAVKSLLILEQNSEQCGRGLYINDVPTTSNSTMATFADDTEDMAIGETVESSTRKLQSAVNKSLSGQENGK